MITIAIIEKNQCKFDKIEEVVMPLLYKEHSDEERKMIKEKINEYIWSVIKSYIQFVEVDEKNFVSEFCPHLIKNFPNRQPDDFFYHTEGSYSFPKKFIELVHCQPMWKEYEESKISNINALGCLFSLKHQVIENTCIIISNKYDLSAPYFARLESITKEDIIRVIRRRFFFSCTLIKENTMIKYYYQNPAYLISQVFKLDPKDQIHHLPLDFLRYNLVFYTKNDKSLYLNQIATRINGLHRLHGDVLMLHELEENIYGNLSMREAKRLNVLAYGRLYDRTLKPEETHKVPTIEVGDDGKETKKDVIPLWSRYIVVDNRMKEWQKKKNNCIYCNEEMINPITCSKCFRIKFCSKKCQKDYAPLHNDECFR